MGVDEQDSSKQYLTGLCVNDEFCISGLLLLGHWPSAVRAVTFLCFNNKRSEFSNSGLFQEKKCSVIMRGIWSVRLISETDARLDCGWPRWKFRNGPWQAADRFALRLNQTWTTVLTFFSHESCPSRKMFVAVQYMEVPKWSGIFVWR